MHVIHAFDPGVTTGYCCLHVQPNSVTAWLLEFPDRTAVIDLFMNRLTGCPLKWEDCRHLCVIENYQPGNIGVKMIPLEVIGAIKTMCDITHIDFKLHQPGDRMFTDKRWPGRFNRWLSHSGDALRHALAFAYFHPDILLRDFEFCVL